MTETIETPAAPVEERPFGPTAALMLATGLGGFILGLFTTLAAADEGTADFLKFNERVGPLSGKTLIAISVFFGSWAILTGALARRDLPWKPVVAGMGILLALGFLMTFPTFFEAFE